MQPSRLTILGTGLLGASLGLAVKAALKSCRVVGYAHRQPTLQRALESGAIDEGYDDPARAVRDADLIVLCTPVSLLSKNLSEIASALSPEAVVTDVGSTKGSLVQAAERDHPTMRFVGSHPMAGSEKRGVDHASPDLYRNALCILTPTARTNRDALAKVEAFWRTLGMRIKHLDPHEHDRLICDVSHLPHAVAAAVVSIQKPDALDLAGKGFLDATRIAGGDGGLWRDILIDNRQNVVSSIARLRAALDQLESMLTPDKAEDLRRWLDAAAKVRTEMQNVRAKSEG